MSNWYKMVILWVKHSFKPGTMYNTPSMFWVCLLQFYRDTHWEGILTRSLNHLDWLLVARKCCGFTQISLRISALITLSITVNPVRKFILLSLPRAYDHRWVLDCRLTHKSNICINVDTAPIRLLIFSLSNCLTTSVTSARELGKASP